MFALFTLAAALPSVLSATLPAALPSAPTLADVWVGAPGSGYPFTDIQAAIDAAAPGDRIFVDEGDYAPFAITKPVQVSGQGSDITRIVAGAGEIPIEILGGWSTGLARLSNFELTTEAGVSAAPPAFLRAAGVTRGIELCNLKVVREQHDAVIGGGAYLDFSNCSQVSASAVRVVTSAGPAGDDLGADPLVGMRAVNSSVWFSFGRISASGEPTDAGSLEVPGADAILLENSTCYLALSDVQAGVRSGPATTAASGVGMRATDSTIHMHGGKNNRMAGGDAAVPGAAGQSLAGAALALQGNSFARWGEDVTFVAGDGPGTGSPTAVDAGPQATVAPLGERLPSMWIADATPVLGSHHTVFLEGDPFAVQLWWLVERTISPLQLPGFDGPLVLDPTADLIIHHAPVFLDENGLGTDIAIGNLDTNLQGLMLAYQSVEVDGGALFEWAPPWFITFDWFLKP